MQSPLYTLNPSCGTHRAGTMGYVASSGYTAAVPLIPHYGRSGIGEWWDKVTPGETNYERAERQIAEDKAQEAAIRSSQKSLAKFAVPEIGVAPLLVTLLGIGGVLWYAQRGN